MKKRISVVFVFLVLCMLVSIPAFAAQKASMVEPSLSFTGTTANCSVSITALGKTISATMELWHGSTRLASWSDNGTSLLSLSETYPVVSGLSYTLKVSGTIGSAPFNTELSAVC